MRAPAGRAALSVGPSGAAFVELAMSGLTLRGLVPPDAAQVRARRWVSFGGVYFPGASAPLPLRGAHDGKLVVAAPQVDGFTLAEGGATAELACADASLAADVDGVLARELPPSFKPSGAPRPMLLKRSAAVPVSAEPTGPVAGTFCSWPPRRGRARDRAQPSSG